MTESTVPSLAVGVRINVSRDGAMAASALSFHDPSSLVTELVQNARRAGATRVDITFEEKTRCLTVTDDGSGVEHLESMFDLYGQDGWREPSVAAEQPFGIGMAAALHYGEHVVVRSRGRRLDVPCEQARAFAEFFHTPDDDPVSVGTIVRVEGVRRLGRFASGLDVGLFEGFALPVTYNGTAVARPNADAADFVDTPLGRLRMTPLETCLDELRSIGFHDGVLGARIYWGGVEVHRTTQDSRACVLHLRPGAWPMSAPDRRRPQDAPALAETVGVMLRQRRDAELSEMFRRSGQTATEYVLRHAMALDALRGLGHVRRLLAEAQTIPACWVSQLPVQVELGTEVEDYLAALEPEDCLTRQQAEDGTAPVIDAGDIVGMLDDPHDALMTLWCSLTKARIVNARHYDDGHWLHGVMQSLEGPGFDPWQPHFDPSNDIGPALSRAPTQAERVCEPRVTIHGAHSDRAIDYVGHTHARVRVVPCAGISLSLGGWRVATSRHAVCLDRVLYVPPGAAENAILQAVDHYDHEDETYNHAAAELEQARFGATLRQLNGSSSREVLRRLLGLVDWQGFEALAGKSFSLTFAMRGGNPALGESQRLCVDVQTTGDTASTPAD